MRSLLKLSLASLAAVALFAGIASAQDDAAKMTVNAIFRNAFELATKTDSQTLKSTANGNKDTLTYAESGVNDDWQSDLYLTWESNSVRARWQLRFRDDGAPNPNASRTDIYWKASSGFWLGALMRAEGIEPGITVGYSVYGGTVTGGAGMTYLGSKGTALTSGAFLAGGLTSQSAGPGGGVGPLGFFSNVNGLDFRFIISPTMTAGLAILDNCQPACGWSATDPVTGTAYGAANVGNKADQTLLPYFQGAFGPLTLGVYLTSASAKIAEVTTTNGGISTVNTAAGKVKDKDSQSATAQVTDVNGKVALGSTLIGFEVWSSSQSCNTKTLKGCSAMTESAVVLGVALPAGPGVLKAHIESISDAATAIKNVDLTQTVSDLMVEYAIPVSPNLKLVPLYTTRTYNFVNKIKNTSESDDTRTTSFLALGMRGDF